MSEIIKQSEIKFTVSLDENRIPSEITWLASDAGMKGPQSCRSILLSVWDHVDKSTLRIDLWTKEMTVDEMKQFFHETFVTMADSYERACSDEAGANEIRKFAQTFAEKTEILKKK
jgi:gliding motility-associated protein GldC